MFKKVALVGNPNVGKSLFFNYITGTYVDVSNFPGTTVDISTGKYKEYYIIDTPGVYGISSFNDEELVTKEVVLDADIILNIIDAKNLERDLFLTLQLLDMGKPIVIAVNMIDEAKNLGRQIDMDKLSSILGVNVIPTIASKNVGLDIVCQEISNAKTGVIDFKILKEINKMSKVIPWHYRVLLLEEDEPLHKKYKIKREKKREEYYLHRRNRVNSICNQVISDKKFNKTISNSLSDLLLHPFWGIVSLAFILYIIFLFIGDIISQRVVAFTEGYVMATIVQPALVNIVSNFISNESFLGYLLIGEYGIFTLTITYLLGLLLPLVLGFYFVISIMEDTGYLPRIAVLLDRVMTKIGLNGKGIIPIILGFGCVTMATITTRVLGTQRERTIATVLLALAIPCSAQLAVIVGLLAPLGLYYIGFYIICMFVVFLLTGRLLSMVVPGKTTPLLIDIPPLRFPRISNTCKKTLHKTMGFLKDAAPLFAIGAILICFLQHFGLLIKIQNLMTPITVNWLGLPEESANIFIMGLIRRDFGAAGLYALSLTPEQIVVALVTITLFVPCIASMIIIIKERGLFSGVIIFVLSILIAFLTGGVVAFII